MSSEKFDQWAVLELFGHKRLAGRCQETTLAGGAFLRVDVPEGDGFTTKFYNPQSIYSISPVSETVARAVATHIHEPPIQSWELPRPLLAAPSPNDEIDF